MLYRTSDSRCFFCKTRIVYINNKKRGIRYSIIYITLKYSTDTNAIFETSVLYIFFNFRPLLYTESEFHRYSARKTYLFQLTGTCVH